MEKIEKIKQKISLEQYKKFLIALGDGESWPEMTDDPIVNFYLDFYLRLEEKNDWEDLTNFEKQIYIEEALDIKENG